MNDLAKVTVEDAKQFLKGSFPGDLGIEPLVIEDGRSVGRIIVDERHLHPGGLVHGGVWTALADTVAAWVTFRSIPPGSDFSTLELKVNIFAASSPGDTLTATATPIHKGRTTVVVEVRVERAPADGGEPRLGASFVATQFVLSSPRRP